MENSQQPHKKTTQFQIVTMFYEDKKAGECDKK